MLVGCQDKDYEISEPILAPMSQDDLKGELVDNDYVWSWSPRQGQDIQVTVLRNGQMMSTETSSTGSYTHHNVETKVPYTYIFKLTDGTNFSRGVILSYMRSGADPVGNIVMTQVEKDNATYDALVEWSPSDDASEHSFVASSGARVISETLPASADSYVIENVLDGEEWSVTITAVNADGKSLPSTGALKIGKTAVGFLSEYPTEEDLISNGDDDEACAWLWLKSEYPAASYIYFGDITSAEDLDPYRVLFWMRDLEDRPEDDVFNMPEVVNNATPFVKEWYASPLEPCHSIYRHSW